jgi:hypothetical protein
MNNKPDPRLSFYPEQALREVTYGQHSWLPTGVSRDVKLSRTYWLTRAARGISWHRFGRASQEPQR